MGRSLTFVSKVRDNPAAEGRPLQGGPLDVAVLDGNLTVYEIFGEGPSSWAHIYPGAGTAIGGIEALLVDYT